MMELLTIFLGIYGAVNLFGFLFLSIDITCTFNETKLRRFLIFPMLWERLRQDINITGSIIATILFTIGLLPAIALVYIMGLFHFLIGAITYLYKETFKRRD